MKIVPSFLLALFAFFSWIVASTAQPSFDCSKAMGFVEGVICSNIELSYKDRTLAQYYRSALVQSPDALTIKSQQRDWIAARNRCRDVTCVRQAYDERMEALSEQIERGDNGGSCAPKSTTARILKSANPNDFDPAWSGESYIGTSWNLSVGGSISNAGIIYKFGHLITPRGGVQPSKVFVLADEWNCDR